MFKVCVFLGALLCFAQCTSATRIALSALGRLGDLLNPDTGLGDIQNFLNQTDNVISDVLDRLTKIVQVPGEVLTAIGTYIVLVKQNFIAQIFRLTGIDRTRIYKTIVGFLGKVEGCFLLSLKNIPGDMLETLKEGLKTLIKAIINVLIVKLQILRSLIQYAFGVLRDPTGIETVKNIFNAVGRAVRDLASVLVNDVVLLGNAEKDFILALVGVPVRIIEAIALIPASKLLQMVGDFNNCVTA